MSTHSSSPDGDIAPSADYLGFVRRVLFLIAIAGLVWFFTQATQAVLMALTSPTLVIAFVLYQELYQRHVLGLKVLSPGDKPLE